MKRRIFANILVALFGLAFIILGIMEIVDSFWAGMGSALVFIPVLRLVQMYRFAKNEDYRQAVVTEASDERNRFLRCHAWAWSAYLFILLSACAAIVFKLVGQELLSMAAGASVCIVLLLYAGSLLVLRKKY